MPIYHKDKPSYFNEALHSIWDKQTTKPNQIVLVEDGPLSEDLYSSIQQWKELLQDKLTIVSLPTNLGLGNALNEGLKHCSHELVARMDSDDVSLPHRFETQLAVFQNDSNIDVCGGWIEEFNEDTGENQTIQYPQNHNNILLGMKKRNSIAHVTTLFRNTFFKKAGQYNQNMKNEDFELWIRGLKSQCQFYNLQEVLVKVRTSNAFFNRRKNFARAFEVMKIKFNATKYFSFGISGYIYAVAHFILFMLPSSLKQFMYKNFR
jgi:glycosyltransferase involved in cell wall biosynthesis